MKFKIKDINLCANLYSVYIFQTNLTERQYYQIASLLRYYCKKDGVSWLCVYSMTESRSAKNQSVKSNKRGRPRKVVTGERVAPHCHLALIGTPKKSAYQTALRFKRAMDKKYSSKICRVVSLGSSLDAISWISYCNRQASISRSGGEFDFMSYS